MHIVAKKFEIFLIKKFFIFFCKLAINQKAKILKFQIFSHWRARVKKLLMIFINV